MIPELKEKINSLNKIVEGYQKGKYSEDRFKKVLDRRMRETFLEEVFEESSCGNPHNNGDESCMECAILKMNI
jgi:hypothetical protein